MNQKFHAHIYFQPIQQSTAEALFLAIADWSSDVVLGSFHFKPVGPHLLPMFTAMFNSPLKVEFTQFLDQHRNELSILIHEDTGDDYRDHTEGAEWLGEKLPLNFEHFERIKTQKSALVFPE